MLPLPMRAFIPLGILAVVSVVVYVAFWWWERRSTSTRVLAEELYTKSRMDTLTRATAQAMRDAVRRR